MTTATPGTLIRLLQREKIDGRQKFAVRESSGGRGDELGHVLRAAAQIHQADFAAHAAGDEVRAARVTDVV